MNVRSTLSFAPLAVVLTSLAVACSAGAPQPGASGDTEAVSSSVGSALSTSSTSTFPTIDVSQIDFRRSWQSECDEDNRYSYPGSYWVTTKDGKCTPRRRTGTTGEWRSVDTDSTGRCEYVWRSDDPTLPPLGMFQDAAELEGVAKKDDDGPRISAVCTSNKIPDIVVPGLLSLIVKPCGDCCPDCALRRDGDLIINARTSQIGKTATVADAHGKTIQFKVTSTKMTIKNIGDRLSVASKYDVGTP